MRHSNFVIALLALLLCSYTGYAIQDDSSGRLNSPPPKNSGGTTKTGSKPRPPAAAPKSSARAKGSGAAELTINSTLSGCQVLLNGQMKGMTNESGILNLPKVKPGSYKLLLRKSGYRDEERMVTLTAGSNMQSFALTPLPGTLIVMPNLPGARIVIGNVGEYSDKVNMPLPAGNYQIVVSKPGHRTVTREVAIRPAEAFNLPVTLEKIPTEELLREAKASYDQQNYSAAISLASAVLITDPNQAKANALVGMSIFSSGNYADSLPYLDKAVTLGESISFPVKHRHGGSWAGKTLCSGSITLSQNTFEFHSTDYIADDFRISYNKIYEMAVKDEIRLFAKVKVMKPDGKETEKGYDFYSTDANAQGRMVYCSSCLPQMRIIIQLVRQFKERSQ